MSTIASGCQVHKLIIACLQAAVRELIGMGGLLHERPRAPEELRLGGMCLALVVVELSVCLPGCLPAHIVVAHASVYMQHTYVRALSCHLT